MTVSAKSAQRVERLTLAVLMCGVAALALSDFVSPFYWGLSVMAALLRLRLGPRLALTEMQASFIGWFGLFWVALELLLGRALVVAFTDFLLILALAVVIEAATPRNHLHRMLVGLFLTLAAAVLTDSVLYAVPLAALMWLFWRASACLYGLNWPGGDLASTPVRTDLRSMSAMLALTALLFASLPRFGFHSLFQPVMPRMQTSGFSSQVALGDFARELDARVVMRVESADVKAIDPVTFRKRIQGRYWRGAALSHFTGKGWRMAPGRGRLSGLINQDMTLGAGQGTAMAVYREASDHAFIALPDGLLGLRNMPQAAMLDDTGAVRFRRAPSRRLRLLMQVGERGALPPMRPPSPSESDVALIPEPLSDWAAAMSAGARDRREALQRMAAELRTWTYDLESAPDEIHPLTSFLKNRRGHCELFAATLALAARSLGVPARVVNGYYAGEWNEPGGFLLIRRQHAHSWVELWLDGRWQSMDATPASRWQLSAVRFPAIDAIWETVKLGWYRYVLEFQNSDRARLLLAIWQYLRRHALLLLAPAAAMGLLIMAWRRRARRRARHGAGWPVMDRWLSRHGVRRARHQPLRQVAAPPGVQAAAWQAFVQRWEQQAYAGGRPWRRREIKRHLRALFKRC
jgi:hypothetical protein